MAGSQNPADYSVVHVLSGFAATKLQVAKTVTALDRDGRVNQASVVRRAWADFERELHSISARVAKLSHESIVREEESSRVRPDTHGAGGPRLGDFVGQSTPFSSVPGTVLVNDERALQEGGVDWWWTNEEGYSGHIGREIVGVFMPGGVPPNPSDAASRTHPLFRPLSKGPKGTIQEPIPERRFVLRGSQVAEGEWHRLIQQAKNRLMSELRRATVRPGRRP